VLPLLLRSFREPLKYVAKLRYLNRQRRQQQQQPLLRPPPAARSNASAGAAGPPTDHLLLLKVDLDAGHFAASGAGERLRQRAEKAAFIIRALGLGE